MSGTSRPRARTFQPRRRKLGPTRAASFARLLPLWGLDETGPPLDVAALTADAGASRVVLDIGFGYGTALVELAARAPDELVLGVEVHTPGVAWVLDQIEARGLHNVRVVHGDVLEFLPRLPSGSLDAVRIWFPDPWPKARQQHRRLVDAAFVAAITDRLRPGGLLHLATDVDSYAAQMSEAGAAEPRLSGGRVPRPADRPVTPYERRGADAGRQVVDLLYRRVR